MTDDTQGQQAAQQQNELDPKFFAVVNEYLELTNKHSKEHGLKRISMASLYAAARFNVHTFMSAAGANVAAERQDFLNYMTKLYRTMLNEHLDGLGHERGVNVGESELQAEIDRQAAARAAQENTGA
ncbi:DUF3224 domain containing protein [Lysobacter dokdonensis DS-58]|uniref:DUF3224 domain containing protein n=1 Tax=Lysobacter dokdonensis DS-58 TaxID=1300345 RepID=A0A0A2X1Y1_9GAMM|nr:DUF3144 domain-containing protein [Lysobacter dokdonensis]KGQ19189.1 DUF3224 domain containing protein [Lysobacter dokdonensis DS-58]